MPTNWTNGLLPESSAANVLTATQEQSVVLSLATVRRLPAHVEYLPLVSNAPEAAWIDVGEKKKFSEVIWSSEKLSVRELAVVTYVPDAIISDAGFDVEGETERELGGALARELDRTVLFGGGPNGFPPGGIATVPITGTDALDAIDKAMAAVEATGVPVTGIIGGPSIASALRGAYREAAALPSVGPANVLFGVPLAVSPVWDSSKGDAIVGNFSFVVIGIRQDVSAETSTDGVLTDDDGAIVISAFESDSTLIRCHGRFAAAVGKPVGPSGDPVVPFATAKWTTDDARAAGQASTAKAARK